jgi:hypothetical protein
MSNFAQRLVARGAGQPLGQGVAVLTPRPLTRFEPQPIAENQLQTAEIPVSPRRQPDSPTVGPMTGSYVTGRDQIEASTTKLSDARPAPLGEAERPTVDAARASDAAVPPLRQQMAHAMPSTAQHQSVPLIPGHEEHADRHEQAGPLASAKLAVEQPERPQPPGFNDDADAPPVVEPSQNPVTERTPPTTPARTAMAADDREREGQQPLSPMISIGRIEVQFLPQQQPMPAPRLQPQRTRGFDAYARARRGEPR